MIVCLLLSIFLLASTALAGSNPYVLGAGAPMGGGAPGYEPIVCTQLDVTSQGTPTFTQDITCSALNGLTPKAAIILVGQATSLNASVPHAKWSWMITDGVRTRSNSIHSSNGEATSSLERYGISIAGELGLHTTGASGSSGEAFFNSWITNGIRLDWVQSPVASHRLIAIFFAGDDILDAYVNHLSSSGTVPGTVDVTDPGFTPTLVMAFSHGTSSTENFTAGAGSNLGIGWAWNQATDVNVANRYGGQNLQTTSQSSVGIHDDAVTVADFGNGFELGAHSFGGFDSSGFTVTTLAASSGVDIITYLALNIARSVWVGTFATPTSTGNTGITVGFMPYHLQLFCNMDTTLGTWSGGEDNTSAGSMVFGAGEVASQGSIAYTNQDNVGTTNTTSFADSAILRLRKESDGTALASASFSAATASQATLNYTVVDGANAYQCIGLAIE